MDSDVAAFLNELDCGMLWENPQHFTLRDVTVEGKTTRQCVCIQSVIPVKAAPTQPSPASEIDGDTEI
jgi:hypothetical protein